MFQVVSGGGATRSKANKKELWASLPKGTGTRRPSSSLTDLLNAASTPPDLFFFAEEVLFFRFASGAVMNGEVVVL